VCKVVLVCVRNKALLSLLEQRPAAHGRYPISVGADDIVSASVVNTVNVMDQVEHSSQM